MPGAALVNTDVMFSSASDEWETPPELFAKLDAEFHFTLDVAASPLNFKCQAYFSPVQQQDGLIRSWDGQVCWMNPPYGRAIGKWMAKAWLESAGGRATVVCLVPARTDTRWWHDYVVGKGEVRFLKGRVKFIKPGQTAATKRQGAPFPSAIVIYRPSRDANGAVPSL